MVNERYPTDITIGLSDFDKVDCQKILSESSGDGYIEMYCAFSKAAHKSIDDGNPKQAKIYWLLSNACSMSLSPDSTSEPFKPLSVSPAMRTTITDDFSDEDISFFSKIVTDVMNVRLRARLADIAWLKAPRGDYKNALIAIDSYRKVPLNIETWIKDGQKCWHRAIKLASMLGDGSGSRIQEMENDIRQAFDSSTESDGYFALSLAHFISRFNPGKDDAVDIAEKLEILAGLFENSGDLHQARDYYDSSSKWYNSIGDKKKSAKMIFCYASCFEKEAIACTDTEQPDNIAAASLYEKAIQILRNIPKAERSALKVDEYIAKLRKLLSEAGQLSLSEINTVISSKMDITQLIEAAKSAVSQKSPIKALMAFLNSQHLQVMRISEMQACAIKQIKQYLFPSLLTKTYKSYDGRVIAKINGINPNETLQADNPNVQASVMQNYNFYLGALVQGHIIPSLDILHLEHRIREVDFMRIVQKSPVIPPGREGLFSKGFFFGYDYDYMTALHLLVPQIEYMVRYLLKNADAETSTLDGCGIESEKGLSALVALPEMKTVFGEDLTFEIKALFCDPLGANLRNELAHGFIDHNSCDPFHSIYAWWFTLKLVSNTSWKVARQENHSEQKDGARE